MKENTSVATVIGDLIGSRKAPDRSALHDRLVEALESTNAAVAPLVGFHITTGDECQACFETVGAALSAVLRLRLALLPEADLRFGVGWGGVTLLSEEPRVEDGPGWWAARGAIEAVAGDAARTALRRTRVAYRRADGIDGPDEAGLNAALRLRDELVGSLSPRSVGVLRGLLDGRSQTELAEELGISVSAVSQRVRSDGLAMLVAAEADLERVS